jgi:hypothetical protein
MLPEEYFVADLRRQRILRWAVFGGVVLAGVLAAAYPVSMRAREKENVLVPLRASVANQENLIRQSAPGVIEAMRGASTRQLAARELLKQPYWNEFLSDVATAAGDEIKLTELEIDKHVMGDDEARTEVYVVNISGEAPSGGALSGFMRRLSGSDHVHSLEFEVSSEDDTTNGSSKAVSFSIQGIVE